MLLLHFIYATVCSYFQDMEKKIDETENEVSKEKYLSIKETTEVNK